MFPFLFINIVFKGECKSGLTYDVIRVNFFEKKNYLFINLPLLKFIEK